MTEPLTADQAWDFTRKHRSDIQNAPWPDVRVKNAAMYAGMKGIAQAADGADLSHYAILFRQEYVRLCQVREKREDQASVENMAPLEAELYRLADQSAAMNRQMMGIPERLSNADAMARMRAGFNGNESTRERRYQAMSDAEREATYAELDRIKKRASDEQ